MEQLEPPYRDFLEPLERCALVSLSNVPVMNAPERGWTVDWAVENLTETQSDALLFVVDGARSAHEPKRIVENTSIYTAGHFKTRFPIEENFLIERLAATQKSTHDQLQTNHYELLRVAGLKTVERTTLFCSCHIRVGRRNLIVDTGKDFTLSLPSEKIISISEAHPSIDGRYRIEGTIGERRIIVSRPESLAPIPEAIGNCSISIDAEVDKTAMLCCFRKLQHIPNDVVQRHPARIGVPRAAERLPNQNFVGPRTPHLSPAEMMVSGPGRNVSSSSQSNLENSSPEEGIFSQIYRGLQAPSTMAAPAERCEDPREKLRKLLERFTVMDVVRAVMRRMDGSLVRNAFTGVLERAHRQQQQPAPSQRQDPLSTNLAPTGSTRQPTSSHSTDEQAAESSTVFRLNATHTSSHEQCTRPVKIAKIIQSIKESLDQGLECHVVVLVHEKENGKALKSHFSENDISAKHFTKGALNETNYQTEIRERNVCIMNPQVAVNIGARLFPLITAVLEPSQMTQSPGLTEVRRLFQQECAKNVQVKNVQWVTIENLPSL